VFKLASILTGDLFHMQFEELSDLVVKNKQGEQIYRQMSGT